MIAQSEESSAAAPMPVRPAIRRVIAVVNAASGSVGPEAAETLRTMLAERGLDATVLSPDTKEIADAIKQAVDSAPDLLIILAGDGTARLAAELSGPTGPLIAPLPGGTMNLLPHALYGARAWPDALIAALDVGVERMVSGGVIGGHPFYCSAILGSPALWARAREAVRKGRLLEAWRRAGYALRRAFTGDIHYVLEARWRRTAEAVVLISPMISKVMGEETSLEVAALEMHSAREVFRLAINGLLSDWRRDPGVVDQFARYGHVWARRSIPAILDGEMQRLRRGARFEFTASAFRVLAPPANDTETAP
jgi:diacylglycerol kinase family enzyme